MPGSKFSNGVENNSFATSFMYLKLRRECKEESKARIRFQDS